MIFHENRLPADDSHDLSCLICYFRKSAKIWNCRLLQILGGALWVNHLWWKAIFVTIFYINHLFCVQIVVRKHISEYFKKFAGKYKGRTVKFTQSADRYILELHKQVLNALVSWLCRLFFDLNCSIISTRPCQGWSL